jgi:ornithine cyclodeaminase/alanine dehydrogenase-like protein (mu-crystallin family)
VAIAVSAALGSQINVLKIEQKSRALRIFRFETERIFSATRRAENEQHLAELLATNNLCRLKSAPLQIEDGTNVLTFTRHELNAEALPSFSSVFYIRPPAVSDPAAATDGKTLRSGR